MRKYYQLTSSGQKRIDDFLEEWKELERMYEFVKERMRKSHGLWDRRKYSRRKTRGYRKGGEFFMKKEEYLRKLKFS